MPNYSEEPGRMYHIQIAKGEVGKYVMLPGDPGRCEKIAAFLDDPVLV
ncbi:MAG: uridine phosphorylase, partial [bacterium]